MPFLRQRAQAIWGGWITCVKIADEATGRPIQNALVELNDINNVPTDRITLVRMLPSIHLEARTDSEGLTIFGLCERATLMTITEQSYASKVYVVSAVADGYEPRHCESRYGQEPIVLMCVSPEVLTLGGCVLTRVEVGSREPDETIELKLITSYH